MKALIQKIKRLLRDRRFRRLWSRTISVVAALVVFVTTYALVLPAITMEREAYCGIPAHQHTDACFEQRLICTIPESPGHRHNDSCYTTHQELVCQMEEHTHDPTACYDEEGTLVCQLPEHTHDQTGCWKDVTELTCTTEESDGHRHSDACYENALVCGMEVHTHSEECYHNPDEDAEANAVAAMQDGGDGTGAETPDEGVVFETYGTFAEDADYEPADPNGEDGLPADDGTGIPYDEPILNEEALLNEEGLPGGEGLPSDEGIDGMAAGQEIEGGGDGLPAGGEGTTNGEDGMSGQGTDGNPDAALDENGNPTESTQTGTDENGNPVAGTQTELDENGNPIVDPNAPQETAETTDTAQAATGGELDPAANTYVPNLAPIDFAAVLNKRTGIFYYAVQEGETVEDSSSISGWEKIEKNTELGPNDLLRVYLSYTIPAGSLNKTNPTAVYRLPVGLRLTDAQVNAINAVENGIAAQYIDYNTLTLTDPDNYHRYLGAEAIEGTRKPDQDLNEYLKEHTADGGEAQEFISATVRVENVYGTEGGSGEENGTAILGQSLIFTFSPYTIEKNQHTYDASGQPTRAGEKVRGWITLDFNLGQVELGEPRLEEVADADAGAANPVNAENAEDGAADGAYPAAGMEGRLVRVIRTAEIVFVQEDQTRGLEEISTQITVVTEEELVNTGETPADGNDHPAETDEDDANIDNNENEETGHEEPAVEDKATGEVNQEEQNEKPAEDVDGKNLNPEAANQDREKTDEEKEAELKEALASMMPAMSFEDSIRVRTGKPAGVAEGDSGAAAASAAEALPRKAKVTVRVEADEGTFPVGTTMVLSAVDDLDAVAETVRDAVENGAAGEAPENGEATDVGSDHATGNAEMTNPANAANASNNPKTYGFQAVDISFRDADGNEIEPVKPVRVALTSEIVEQIKKDKETDETTAIADPVVVHVDDKGNAEKMDLIAPEEIEPAQGRTEEEIREELEKAAADHEAAKDENSGEDTADTDAGGQNQKEGQGADAQPTAPDQTDTADTENSAQEANDEISENAEKNMYDGDGQQNEKTDDGNQHVEETGVTEETTVFFDTDSFSVYAIVYTVDFHYEADGKIYEFSIPGGGFVSLEHIVEVLGIGLNNPADESNTSNISSENATEADETKEHIEGTDPSEDAIHLNHVPVSEATKVFVTDVANVEFSSPWLVWVGKADQAATVGELKEANGLECLYSAELTEEQIGEINSGTVEAGDWALISLKPFMSEERLTVTMKNGDQFTVKVTDAQISTNIITADGMTFKITVTYDEAAQIPAGTILKAEEIGPETDAYLQYLGRTWSEVNRIFAEKKEGGKDSAEDRYVNVNAARFFDIKLICDGGEIEPKAPVLVEITYLEGLLSSDRTKPGVVHFKSDEVEIIDQVDTSVEEDTTVRFRYEQDSFSVIGTYIQQETGNAETPPLGAEYTASPVEVPSRSLKAARAEAQEETEKNDIPEMPPIPLRSAGEPEAEESSYTQDNSGLPYPTGNKTLEPNEDGTYTLTLSVKGSSQTTIQKNQKKANVLFVMDRSSSMITNTVSDDVQFWYYGTRDTAVFREDIGGRNPDDYQFWGVANGQYVRLNANFSSWSNVNFTYWNGYYNASYPTNGALYVRSKTTRLYAEQVALDDVIGRLLAYNTTEIPDEVEIAVISFADHRADTKGWTDTEHGWVSGTDKSDLMEAVNKTRYASGTNWEEALQYAYDIISAKKNAESNKPEEDYYVVFLTDGEPTNVVGDTEAAAHTTNPVTGEEKNGGNKYAYDQAKDDALKLVRDGFKFYNIFTYRVDEPIEYSKYLTNYAYSNGESDYNQSDTEAINTYFSDAQTIDALNDTFEYIFQTIADIIGHAHVSITDTLTTDAMTTTVVQGKTNGYVYTVKNPEGDILYTVTAAGDISGPAVTFNVPGSATKTYTGDQVTENNGMYEITTDEGDVYRIALADVNNTTGELEWDLSPVGILMNDCEYSVSFVVWPDQQAYDYVAALNNGLAGYDWDTSLSTYQDLRGTKGYEIGGVDGYPSIVKKSNGTFAVLTNEDQKLHYSVVEMQTINGEINGEPDTHGPYYQDLQTPDPMPLTATESALEKAWNVERAPWMLAQLLYDENGNSTGFYIEYDVYRDGGAEETDDGEGEGAGEGSSSGEGEDAGEGEGAGEGSSTENTRTPYTTIRLGWDETQGKYIWEPGSTRTVTYNGHPVVVGTRWAQNFSIATGLMLSSARMEALGLDKTAYPSGEFGGVTYYILESGHDYKIEEVIPEGENSWVTYEFDYTAPVYHPMLVDGVLRSVNLSSIEGVTTITEPAHEVEITSMTDAAFDLESLKIENTLRGYINLEKHVVGKDGKTPQPEDDTKFTYTISLYNSTDPGPFTGDSIPWYGVNGLFYHDDDYNYYQAVVTGVDRTVTHQSHTLTLTTESGDVYDAWCTEQEGIFDEDIPGPTSVTYHDGTQEITIALHGNEMDCTDPNHVSATLKMMQSEILNLANIPVGSIYTIKEEEERGYDLINIRTEIRNGSTVESSSTASDISDGSITGTIVADRDNHVIFTNKIHSVDITVNKVDENGIPLPGAVFTLTKAKDGDETEDTVYIRPAGTETGTDTGVYLFEDLPDGSYTLEETTVPTGYAGLTSQVTFTIIDGKISGEVNRPENVTWDGENLKLTVPNTPVIEEGRITVRKQWLDFYGNPMDYDGTLDLKLVQWVPELPPAHTVRFYFRCTGDGNGNIYYPGHISSITNRSGTGIGDVTIQWDWNQWTKEQPFDIDGLLGSTYTSVWTRDGVNFQNDGTDRGGRQTLTIHNVMQDLTLYITIRNGGHSGTNTNLIYQPQFAGAPSDPDAFVPTNGTKTITLGTGGVWTQQFNVSGNGLLSNSSTTLPATYNGLNCYYTIAEESVPEGFTLQQISTDQVRAGVLTAYNRKNTVDLTVEKVDCNNTAVRLNGAAFTLRQIDPEKTGNMDTRGLEGGRTEAQTTAGEGSNKGMLTFGSLALGYYEIRETLAPDGYILSSDPAFYIRVAESGVQILRKDESKAAEQWTVISDDPKVSIQNATLTVVNEPGSALPNSGGPGTLRIYLTGLLLTALAGLCLWIRREYGGIQQE